MTQAKQPQDWVHALDLAAKAVAELDSREIYVPALIRDRLSELREESSRALATVDGNLRVALAGKFSCGKSSFINSALGAEWESLAPVKLERTTRCATNFRYGEALRISDASGHVYTREEYQEKVASDAPASDFLEFTIELPVETLKDVVIVDTPGFDPPPEDVGTGNKSDEQVSREAVGGADIVLFLAEMGDGTIQSDSMDYLKEIAADGKPFYLILSKADLKKPASKRLAILQSIRAECERNGLRPLGVLPYCAIREDQLPSSVREDAMRWRGELHGRLDGLATFKQTLLGHRNQAMVDNYVANVQNFLNKNLRFFKSMRQRVDDRPTQKHGKEVALSLTGEQQRVAENLFAALCQAIGGETFEHWTETLPSGAHRLRPDLMRTQFPTFPLGNTIKTGIFAFLKDYSDEVKAEGMKQLLAAFVNLVYAQAVESAKTWSFVSVSLDRLRQRFQTCVLDKLDPDTFLDGVEEVLRGLQDIARNGQRRLEDDLTQRLDELIAFAQ